MHFAFPDCFSETVVELSLSRNRLKEIHPRICDLHNLKILRLDRNEIRSLPKEVRCHFNSINISHPMVFPDISFDCIGAPRSRHEFHPRLAYVTSRQTDVIRHWRQSTQLSSCGALPASDCAAELTLRKKPSQLGARYALQVGRGRGRAKWTMKRKRGERRVKDSRERERERRSKIEEKEKEKGVEQQGKERKETKKKKTSHSLSFVVWSIFVFLI